MDEMRRKRVVVVMMEDPFFSGMYRNRDLEIINEMNAHI